MKLNVYYLDEDGLKQSFISLRNGTVTDRDMTQIARYGGMTVKRSDGSWYWVPYHRITKIESARG